MRRTASTAAAADADAGRAHRAGHRVRIIQELMVRGKHPEFVVGQQHHVNQCRDHHAGGGIVGKLAG
ncbi:hypothetical protein ABMB44_12685 [Levilactobacillus brevis]